MLKLRFIYKKSRTKNARDYIIRCIILERELCPYLNSIVASTTGRKKVGVGVGIVELHIKVFAKEIVESNGYVLLMTAIVKV